MLAGEVTVARQRVGLPRALIAAERRVLADLPVGVGAKQVRVGQRHVKRRPPVPLGRDAREHRLDLLQERRGETAYDLRVRRVALE